MNNRQKLYRFLFCVVLVCAPGAAAPLSCDLSEYKEVPGLRAQVADDTLRLTWQGERGQELRASFGIDNGQPVVRELAARKQGGEWVVLGRNLAPEYHVTTGMRRVTEQQLQPLRALGRQITPEIIEREKWNAFWDSPLSMRPPGGGGPRGNPPPARKPEEVRRAAGSASATGCKVKTDGARLEISFPGLTLGIFSGRQQFTVYKGTNLLRQEAIAKTDEPSVAYHYRAGLKGFRTDSAKRVIWRDAARGWQKYEFGGSPNVEPVGLRARNRLAIVEAGAGSVSVFPPPRKFFFAREIELNLGYVYYRKDDASSFSVGVRQSDLEEAYRPFGISDGLWEKRSRQARSFATANFALYNAPPGTWQRMAVYYYLSPEEGSAAHSRVMAFTHDDRYKPLPGYQVAISHFHTAFHEQVMDAGGIDNQPQWIPAFRALGVNIAMMSDFHGDGAATDSGPLRFRDQNAYFEACRRHSDNDFLIMPGEEPDAHFGGHYTMVFPKPVYWTKGREPAQQFVEKDPKYGTVYHTASEADELQMLVREGGLVWQAHPRTKGSTGYPDENREKEYFRSDRYLGGSFQSLPVDLSESRLCEKRCFGTLDDMNNWGAPKYLISEGDTYHKYPDDETYAHLMVNYIKLGRLPKFDEDWSPVLKAMRAGDFFITSGEVLFKNFSVEGSGNKRTIVADLEWTFPLEFVEVVWGDGDKTERKVIPATDQAPFGAHRFQVPFDAAGKKWVRFAAWDSAGNGAASQPVHFRQ